MNNESVAHWAYRDNQNRIVVLLPVDGRDKKETANNRRNSLMAMAGRWVSDIRFDQNDDGEWSIRVRILDFGDDREIAFGHKTPEAAVDSLMVNGRLFIVFVEKKLAYKDKNGELHICHHVDTVDGKIVKTIRGIKDFSPWYSPEKKKKNDKRK